MNRYASFTLPSASLGVFTLCGACRRHPKSPNLTASFSRLDLPQVHLKTAFARYKDDPTFLMAPVHPVRSYDAINLNANKFESLMHRFFAEARLDIEIMDRFGKPFRPREWFLLPLPVIETAIAMLLDGTILRYRYDAVACAIVPVQEET